MFGTPMFIPCKKLKHVKIALRDFNKKFLTKILDRVYIAKKAMKDAQSMMQQNPLNLDIHKIESIFVKECVRLSQVEESFLRQNSQVQWLNLGDRNSSFFFHSVKNH
jgi:hypothetical protein